MPSKQYYKMLVEDLEKENKSLLDELETSAKHEEKLNAEITEYKRQIFEMKKKDSQSPNHLYVDGKQLATHIFYE
ncbi:hypothetical protein LP032_025 [Listeria phage LP-032]|uniref:Uncharacterized protein n=10 Tax=Homburgvirus TaxID=1921125 RepID=A0A6C0QZS9_9CAUD|nr:DNA replication inhibitor [Listeria phage P70]YP_008240468.1 hypothetical protein LP110_104 [Listeria phage LP-110]YP_008240500.1 hypothetical protein LP037_022 [Listeria phage LP-037]YP_009044110.1 hypothetical protein LP026_025 [Listeria phage LP-026]AHL18874.1 hypothetical protein LP032_025 [Listeria phage LP-032]AWY07686.1 DNA replication inhibitor [Listeria phage LP-KV022]QDK04551.1 hypothetical protein FK481_0037 [Listeria phage LP-010]QDK04659.1 hypothetical protein FK482_0037 [Lis